MKLLKMLSLALVLSSVGVARADDLKSEDAKKFLAFFDKIVDTVIADKDSCPKMATDVNALIDANKDMIELAKKAKADGKKMPEDAKKHMMDQTQKMIPAMRACGNDKNVQAAFQRLDMDGPHGAPPPAKK
jgi:hypothetical protein